jgi:tripartite ATP-independent transporter DctM subunit
MRMSIEIFAIIFIVFTFIILLSGIPVAFVLSGSALLFSLIGIMFGVFDYSYLLAIPNRILGIMSNQNLLAVPLFIFMGLVLEKTKIAEELLMAMNILYKNTDGGFAISVVLVGVLMGASTGIVGASVVTLGLLSLPVMVKNNYPRPLACGVICASGTLGQIIPPSLVLILLADVLSSAYQQAQLNLGIFAPETVTISDLFAGALIPGLLLPVMFIFYIKSLKINNINKNIIENVGQNINIISSFFPPILLIITVLGSIVLGVATPSEAASLGAIGSLLIAFAKNKLSFNVIRNTSKGTIKLTSMVFLILIGATFFSLVFRGFEGEELIQNLLSYGPENKYLSLIITLGIMFFLGFILDFIEIIFIIIPLFGPVLFSYGFDPIWVGILIAMVLQTSFLTPPFGFSLFYLRGVAPKEIPTKDIYKGVLPFIIIQIIAIGLVFMFPQIALFLPGLLN